MTAEKDLPFLRRFWIYQKERFPLFGHGPLIAAFTFSAVSYSRICRGVDGFITWKDFLIGTFATITLFLLVRIFDEFKDKADDAKFRTYLPVPRGLISLKELKTIGWIVAVLQLAVIAVFQTEMLLLYVVVIGYLLLMGVEFWVPEYLKARQLLYITSHMFIIPLVDVYASGLDWLLDGSSPHLGLLFFFVVSYLNGIVLEFGRKLRTPDGEEEGVVSYTKLYGTRGGTLSWIVLMLVTGAFAAAACYFAGHGWLAYTILIALFVLCATPGFLFLKSPTQKLTKLMEYSSALWTVGMYLTLGGVPMLQNLLTA